jgi:hypothetical protein
VWFARSVARMQLEPEVCGELAGTFRDAKLGVRGRKMILELLANVGTPEAQRAMGAIMASSEARADSDAYGAFVQRLSFLRAPDRGALELAATIYDRERARGDRGITSAAAATLANLAGKREARGDAPEARAALEGLRRELAGTHTSREKADLIEALAQGARPEDVPRWQGFARDADPMVRRAAASALGTIDAPAGRGSLLELTTDSESATQRAALGALARQSLGVDDTVKLGELAASGRIARENDDFVLNLLAKRTGDGEPIVGALRSMLAASSGNPSLAGRIRGMLERMGAGS